MDKITNKPKYHISIIGSCVLRDVFNSKFVKQYGEYFIIDSYFARTTIPSLVGKPITYDIKILENDFNYLYFGYNYTECAKCMLSILENNQSDFILLDFYSDAYYGTYQYADSFIRGSLFKLKTSNAINTELLSEFYNFDSNSDKYFNIWCNAFDMFIEYAKAHFPSTKFIINGILGNNKITKEIGGEVIAIQQPNLNITKLNTFWEHLNQYCEQKHNIPVIRFTKDYTLNPNYIFGLNSELVHFHNDYYQDAFNAILEMCNSMDNQEPHTVSNINLIRNSDFHLDTKFWSFSNGTWLVKNSSQNNVIVPPAISKSVWKWIWCDPVEINGDGKTFYTLSFFVTYNGKLLTEDFPIFGIRTFKNAIEKKHDQCLYSKIVKIPLDEIEYQKTRRYTYTFCPTGKFIRIAPHIKMDVCDIEFSNIQLEKGDVASDYKLALEDRIEPYFTINSSATKN